MRVTYSFKYSYRCTKTGGFDYSAPTGVTYNLLGAEGDWFGKFDWLPVGIPKLGAVEFEDKVVLSTSKDVSQPRQCEREVAGTSNQRSIKICWKKSITSTIVFFEIHKTSVDYACDEHTVDVKCCPCDESELMKIARWTNPRDPSEVIEYLVPCD